MIYKEEIRDLFTVDDSYWLAHCVSADFRLGRGIAIEFDKRFDLRKKLREKYPNYLDYYIHDRVTDAECLVVDRVFNLVTKPLYYHKPSYTTMRDALIEMRELCLSPFFDVRKIAIPKIGCGLDRLDWGRVSEIIRCVFDETDIEILICIKVD